MCDYSLQHLASRPAKVGDKLVTTHFNHGLTGGLCAVGKPDVAVCLMPGTELAFEREIERLAPFGMRLKKLGSKVARFRRVNLDRPTMHHDALELPTGEIVLLTRLREGQFATVIQMPATEHQYVATGRATAELAPSPLTPR
jgi:hypothetical protein